MGQGSKKKINAQLPYPAQGDHNRDQLIQSAMIMVEKLASSLSRKMPETIQRADLVQDGVVGLLEALEVYNPDLNPNFIAFAHQRVRGSMLDGVRRTGSRSRSHIRSQKAINQIAQSIENDTSGPARLAQIADTLGMSVQRASEVLASNETQRFLEYNELDDSAVTAAAPRQSCPETNIENGNIIDHLLEQVAKLDTRQRTVFFQYYIEGRKLSEIAPAIGVCDSRVSQIKHDLTQKIRRGMAAAGCDSDTIVSGSPYSNENT